MLSCSVGYYVKVSKGLRARFPFSAARCLFCSPCPFRISFPSHVFLLWPHSTVRGPPDSPDSPALPISLMGPCRLSPISAQRQPQQPPWLQQSSIFRELTHFHIQPSFFLNHHLLNCWFYSPLGSPDHMSN